MKLFFSGLLVVIALAGCNHTGLISKPDNGASPHTGSVVVDTMEPSKLATSLPQFVMEPNETMIADSFNAVDPTLVIGSIIDLKKGIVHSLDNYLVKDAKVTTLTLSETAFHNLVEDSLVANADWLSFVKADVNMKCKAEISVIKSAKVTAPAKAIDIASLKKKLDGIPNNERDKYGVLIGYIDYVPSASLFRDYGAGVKASGYGVNIGGTWYSKAENTATHHRLVAIWAPLPLVAETPPLAVGGNLEKITRDAIMAGAIKLPPISSTMKIVK